MTLNGKNYIAIKDFINLTGIARITIKRYIESGKMDGVSIGRKRWICLDTLPPTFRIERPETRA